MPDTNSSNRALGSGALTPREQQVLTLRSSGASTREIAERLGITPRRVTYLRTRVNRKLGIVPPRERAVITPREQETLRLLAAGHTTAEIARELEIAPATVKSHLTNVYRKIGVKNRVQAARYYLDHLAPPVGEAR